MILQLGSTGGLLYFCLRRWPHAGGPELFRTSSPHSTKTELIVRSEMDTGRSPRILRDFIGCGSLSASVQVRRILTLHPSRVRVIDYMRCSRFLFDSILSFRARDPVEKYDHASVSTAIKLEMDLREDLSERRAVTHLLKPRKIKKSTSWNF